MIVTAPNLVQFDEGDAIPDPTPALVESAMCLASDEDSGLICTRARHADPTHLAGAEGYLAGVFVSPGRNFPADLDVRVALREVKELRAVALHALDAEHEGNFRKAVLALAEHADALRAWVKGA